MKRIKSHAGRDISDLKIYRDDDVGQFKVRHYCEKCNRDLGCYCYDKIEDAMYGCGEIMWSCFKHTLEEVWIDYELAEEIDEVCGTNMTREVLVSVAERDDYSSDAIKAIIESITEKQAEQILMKSDIGDEMDGDYNGEICRT